MDCIVSHLFNLNNDAVEVYNIMSSTASVANKEKNKEKSFYDNLINRLKESAILILHSPKSNNTTYINSIKSLIGFILNDSRFYKTYNLDSGKVKEIILENFLNDTNAVSVRSLKDGALFEEVNIEQLGALEEDNYLYESYQKAFSNIFGVNNMGAIDLMIHRFNRDLGENAIISFKNGTKVLTSADLNRNILFHKNRLLQTISRFLLESGLGSNFASEIHSGYYVNSLFYSTMNKMQEWIKNNDTLDIIKRGWNAIISGEDNLSFDAITSYVLLTYYDDFLKNSLGNVISYENKYKNVEVNTLIPKYKFNVDSSHYRKSFTDSEERTAFLNSSRYSKFIFDIIPLEVNGKDTGKQVGLKTYSSALTKLLKNVSHFNTDPVLKILTPIISELHTKPLESVEKLLSKVTQDSQIKLVLSSKFRFILDEIGALTSVYKYIFLEHKDGITSAKFIERKSKFGYESNSIVNEVVSVTNDIVAVTYSLVETGPDGHTLIVLRSPYKRRHGSEKYMTLVNMTNINNSQSRRKELQNTCKLSLVDEHTAEITLGDDSLIVSLNTADLRMGILTQSLNIKLTPTKDSKSLYDRIFKLFNEVDIIENKSELLNPYTNNEDILLMRNVLKFIDDRLQTKFLSNEGLDKFDYFKRFKSSLNQNSLDDLLLYSLKSLHVSDLYYEFTNALNDGKYTSFYLFKNFLVTKYDNMKSLDNNTIKQLFIIEDGVWNLRTIPQSSQWVEELTLAMLAILGDLISSVSKNLSGNNDANYATGFLGALIFNICNTAYKLALSYSGDPEYRPASSALLFTKQQFLIKDYVVNSDVKNRAGDVKPIKKLKSQELFYNSIVNNFWLNYIDNGIYSILPTTYSDKTKFILYLIDANTKLNSKIFGDLGSKTIHELNKDELKELYRITVGESDRLVLNNITQFYHLLFDDNTLTLLLISSRLASYTEERLVNEAFSKGMVAKLDLHYRKKKINGRESLLLNEVAINSAKYANQDFVEQRFRREEVNFINDLVDSGINFYILNIDDVNNLETKSIEDKLNKSTDPLARIIKSIYPKSKDLKWYLNNWTLNGLLILAKDLSGNPIIHTNTEAITEINPLLEKYFYTNSVLANNLRILLTGFETNHPDKSKFVKLWDNIAESLNIQNPLLRSSKNIKKLLELIWENPDLVFKEKLIDTGDLSESDIMALANSYDLASLLNSDNKEVLEITEEIINRIENMALGTLFKRNVPIPGSMHYLHRGMIIGVPNLLNVAIVDDMEANVFNFTGDSKILDAMDGGAYIPIELRIMENHTLGSQEVGINRKPLWHYYDLLYGVSGLMKFAAFEMNNAIMKRHLNAKASTYQLYKKAMNILWSVINPDGTITWRTGSEIKLGTGISPKTKKYNTFNFATDILNDRKLYYQTYDNNGDIQYRQIIDFGQENGVYYTEEIIIDNYGNLDIFSDVEKVYHLFDADSNHIKVSNLSEIENLLNYHSINSLFELNLAMGGIYSIDFLNGNVVDSESSHEVVVEFMNKTITEYKKDSKEYKNHYTSDYYHQPLKKMMIHYITNNSGMKNGAGNKNHRNKWINNELLSYMPIDVDYLGILMDADHDVESESKMTEPSLVISALELGGFTHDLAKEVYRTLGKVASKASEVEVNTISEFLSKISNNNFKEAKNILYDIIGKTLINNMKSRGESTSLTNDILKEIEKRFNVNIDHNNDKYKIPFSDPNIYSLILPTIMSIINNKSIKRSFFGAGMVLNPSFNAVQYTQIGNDKYLFSDLVKKALIAKQSGDIKVDKVFDTALYEKNLVETYLNYLQDKLPFVDYRKFIPTDVIVIYDSLGNIRKVDLNTLETYYAFKDHFSGNELHPELFGTDLNCFFKYDVTTPKNLAPSRIIFEAEINGEFIPMNVFDLPPFRDSWRDPSKTNRQLVNKIFLDLYKGYYYDNGLKIFIRNLKTSGFESISSNMHNDYFNLGNKSVALIKEEGINAFKVNYVEPHISDNYDLIFATSNGEDVYITFNSPKKSVDNKYDLYKSSELTFETDKDGNIEVILMDPNNRKLFKVGRYILRPDYEFKDGHFVDRDGKIIKNKSLKKQDNKVYEYVEFVSKYKVSEKVIGANDNVAKIVEFDKYYINTTNIKRVLLEGFGRNFDDELDLERTVTAFGSRVLDSIYTSKQFIGININPLLSNNGISSFIRYVSNMSNLDTDFKAMVIDPIVTLFRIDKKAGERTIDYSKYIRLKTENFYNKLATDRYNSWLTSLYYIVARIPALNMQSFMLMENIAYTGHSKNSIYVSVWQYWLLGSDLDIDKGYLMSFFIGDDGKLIKHSNLFDYSSIETLRASQMLPMPQNLTITFTKNESDLNITEDVKVLSLLRETNKAEYLIKIGDLLRKIYNQYPINNEVKVYINPEENINKQFNVVNDLYLHENTKLSASMEEMAYKNLVSAYIQNIVLDLRNMVASNSPITMDDLSDLSENSEKGSLTSRMSQINPLTKYLMLALNMIGKDVIGISAVGIKTFFTLSHYYNEGVRSNNLKWIKNLQFSKTFNRIQNRYNNIKNLGEILTTTKTSLANVNFDNLSEIKSKFFVINEVHDNIRTELGVTDYDIENKTELYNQYIQRIDQWHEHNNMKDDVSQMLSLILSAATDNAKELILSKINCDDNLAKCHLYLLMIGFDIKDVVSFMTSPCINLISNLVASNMMDSFINDVNLKDAINMADGLLESKYFIQGGTTYYNDNGKLIYESNSSKLASKLKNNSNFKEDLNYSEELPNSLEQLVQVYIHERLKGNDKLRQLSKYLNNITLSQNMYFDYVEKMIYLILKYASLYQNLEEYEKDLEEFKKIVKLAEETTTLGGTYLGTNQGLPTSKEELLKMVKEIYNSIQTREREFGLTRASFIGNINYKDTKVLNNEGLTNLISKLIDNNEFITEEIESTLKRAIAFDIIGNFNIESWLLDKQLTINDIFKVTEELKLNYGEEEINIDEIFNKDNNGNIIPISYRELISDYYNLIKGTWNIFDVVNKVPQYKAIFNLFKTEYFIDKYISAKSQLFNTVVSYISRLNNYLKESDYRKINNYINDLLINSFFNNQSYKYPIRTGLEYLGEVYETRVANSAMFIDLSSPHGRASFKKLFEAEVINLQQQYPDNKLIQDLIPVFDKFNVSTLGLELDLMKVGSNYNSQTTFLKYLDDFEKLKYIYIGDLSIADWLMIYNLYVHKNRYGSDRLTSIFKNCITDGSILTEYFNYLSTLDYNQIDESLLKEIGFNIEDVLMELAPRMSLYLLAQSKFQPRYIRTTSQTGEQVILKKLKSGYITLPIFPSNDLTLDSKAKITEDLKLNYRRYLMIPLYNNNFLASLSYGILSNDREILRDALYRYLKKGLLEIFKINC